jgi:hypothetical protein
LVGLADESHFRFAGTIRLGWYYIGGISAKSGLIPEAYYIGAE